MNFMESRGDTESLLHFWDEDEKQVREVLLNEVSNRCPDLCKHDIQRFDWYFEKTLKEETARKQCALYTTLESVVDILLDIGLTEADPRRNKLNGDYPTSFRRLTTGMDEFFPRYSKKLAKSIQESGLSECCHISRLQHERTLPEFINLLHSSPAFLAEKASHYFFTRDDPEGIMNPDAKLVATVKMATTSILDLFDSAYKSAAVWKYIFLLCVEVQSQKYCAKGLGYLYTEIWATCQKELLRLRRNLSRMIKSDLRFVSQERRVSLHGEFYPMFTYSPRKGGFQGLLFAIVDRDFVSDKKVLEKLREIHEGWEDDDELMTVDIIDALGDLTALTAFMTNFRKITAVAKKAPSMFWRRILIRSEEFKAAWEGLSFELLAFPPRYLEKDTNAKDCIEAINKHLRSGNLGVDLGGVYDSIVADALKECLTIVNEAKVCFVHALPPISLTAFHSRTPQQS